LLKIALDLQSHTLSNLNAILLINMTEIS
jgi:hypothetical protein